MRLGWEQDGHAQCSVQCVHSYWHSSLHMPLTVWDATISVAGSIQLVGEYKLRQPKKKEVF